MIKFGIVGFGLAAKVFHLPILTRLAGAKVTAVYSSKPKQEIQAVVPDAEVFDSVDHFIAQADIDVVVVLTPNDFHADIASKAMLANKHVIIDKPFVCSVDEGTALIALAEKQQTLLSVYHNRRWDGDFLTAKKLIGEGKLGELRYFESRFDKYRPRVWGRWREQDRPGAGLIFDLASHLIDQALHLLGLPEKVFAKALAQREGAEANDYYDIQLSYNRGLTQVRLRGSSFARATPFRFYIEGTEGTFIKQAQDVQEAQLAANMSPFDDAFGVDKPANYGQWLRMPPEGNIQNKEHDEPVIIETERGSYFSYYENFVAAVKGESSLDVPAEQALNVIKVIELAFQSSQLGQELDFV
ncbi:Gfo/Idh/MocA family oxidoreductase [Alteromonas sp. a30]|uniref:Gfo/Idh/MocA family oxidoreductase n=1 Tax=Alteromonas sp. a30 TaxID=2730917 RepID=UPI002280C9B0|nr:Gfo/Idh/MocA family oxidoreductase [Alteromonas sp. a30]MCY7296208.1 Gfo/Idh/MocA family oxidoreductase [Alteromonas sp. a30]